MKLARYTLAYSVANDSPSGERRYVYSDDLKTLNMLYDLLEGWGFSRIISDDSLGHTVRGMA